MQLNQVSPPPVGQKCKNTDRCQNYQSESALHFRHLGLLGFVLYRLMVDLMLHKDSDTHHKRNQFSEMS